MNPDVLRARRNTVADLLSRSAARFPDKLALAFREERLTYAQLDTRVNQTAHRFLADGLKRGMRLAVLSKNSLDFAVLVFAAARVGLTIVPINYMLTVPDIAYIIGHCAADALAAPVELAEKLEAAVRDASANREAAGTADTGSLGTSHAATGDLVKGAAGGIRGAAGSKGIAGGAKGSTVIARYLMQSSESMKVGESAWQPMRGANVRGMPTFDPEAPVYAADVAQILYTSGTESKPKGVMLTHDNLIAQYVSVIVGGRMESRDVCVHALPLYHSAQLNCFLGPSVYLGSTGIVLEQADPATILATVERERVSQLFCPPTVWIALLCHPDFEKRDLSTLEKCYYGAAIMPMEVLKELSERLPGALFWNFYGQTEVAPLATALQPEDQMRKLGSAGQATLNVETRIVDDEDNEVPRGTIGEIVHRTAHAMLGYLNDPEKTAAAFQNGWFHSGDLGVMDEEGYITVVDRKKDMIKTGGINVSSREVEEAVYQYPGVSEVAVIGVPDEYWIEAVTAIVVPKPGVTIDVAGLETYCKENLAAFKVPKRIIVVDGLPRNPSGKILKRDLREQYKSLA
ncbi:acyl-CoA synthetase [Alicyclobacillus ferrooxydans]|uniref:Acyl-CoA synthetase n=2 Tax=Alicyclobacillus ferrooxydans TaxID=471514 RepID=A0A0P9D4Y0_9BACL|nr:acyl-CoA synthetase [Alicyclobacillus ferrooxydans]